MARKHDKEPNDPKLRNKSGLSRRDFVKTGAAAGIGAAALLGPDGARAQASTGAEAVEWDYDVDVIVAGGGCAGLTAAIRARDLGATVLVVDQNFDLGGRMLHSGSFTSLGGGDPVQRRDMKGESDKEGFITVGPVEAPEEIDDNIELLFTDITDWSVVDRRGQSNFRYNERELVRAWAENCPATRQFMIDNYVRFARINGTHAGGGLSRARGAVCFLMLGDKTDIKAGTITAEDAGRVDSERTSAFAPVQMSDASRFAGPGADPEFEREAEAPMHRIVTPPFYALSIMVIWHDSYGGLRVNGRQQVIDLQGEVIPGLYAGGEAAGGFNKHGLGKGHVHGYIAGTHAARDPSA